MGLVLLGLLGSADAQRVEVTVRGQVHITGNSLGLSGQTNANGPGIADSAHTLIALDPASVDASPANPTNPWFPGTTADWASSGSGATLSLPAGARVLHAVLLWGGSYNYSGENLSAFLDTQVQFSTPLGAAMVSPQPVYSLTLAQVDAGGLLVNMYRRGAVVTSQVAAAGSGLYTAAGIPVTQHELQNSMNGGGWALVVLAEDAASACRQLVVDLPTLWVDSASPATFMTSLSTPATGPVQGRAYFAVAEGDANRPGDQVWIRDPVSPTNWLPLTGPNNPQSNFFASQINDASGALDTSGTFGQRNHDAAGGNNISGGRQRWDLTAVALSSVAGQLVPQQASTSLILDTTGDSYLPMFVALSVDAAGPCPPVAPACIFDSGFETGEMPCQ